MNLYWKRLFGSLKSTAKVEARFNQRRVNYAHFRKVAESKELAEYNDLFNKVKSPEFRENKRTLMSRKYKDTQWYRDITKFEKLEHNSELKEYFTVLESKDLKEYLAFKETPDFMKLGQPDLVSASPELSRLKAIEKSKEYKTYTRFHDSYILREYLELKEKVTTPEFKQNNEFWANENRWQTTQEYQMENRFYELDRDEDIRLYQKFKKEDFGEFMKYDLVFEENFDKTTLKDAGWEYGFPYVQPEMVKVHSYTNELQANMGGKNVQVADGGMHIYTKADKCEALAWDAERGFMQKSYDYTSDVINCRKAVCLKGGVFSAKMRFDGSRKINHTFWLKGADKTPIINVARFVDGQVEVGVYWNSIQETKYTSERIKGLKPNEFYVYTVEWTDKEIIWYINDFEVFRTSAVVPSEPMTPVFNSFIPEAAGAGAEGDFEIAAVRVFSCKEETK